MVIASRLEKVLGRRARRRRAEAKAIGFAKGRADVDRAWRAWLDRLEEAKASDKPFHEPPPGPSQYGKRTGPPLKIRYEEATDTLTFRLRDDPVSTVDEVAPGLIAGFDDQDRLVSIELRDASSKTNLEVVVDLG